ncbi:MAG: hypothetical protein JEY91_05300 [Spirochaetaceae bacterium]|nr:hypothetical protein [Spirochaetaceae bacterium]
MKKYVYIIFGLIILLLNSSCRLPLMKADYLEIDVKGESFTITWEDNLNRGFRSINRTDKYIIYTRTHGAISWKVLDEIDATADPEFSIDYTMLDPGIYDLGVSSVNLRGQESDIHSSLDMTADPFCGWYIKWIGLK